MFGIIFGGVIYGLCALLFVGLGISNYKSKRPVTINTSIKPPKEENLVSVKEWNRKHGIMWITFGIVFALCYVLGCIFANNLFLAMTFMVIIPILCFPVIMIYHNHLVKTLVTGDYTEGKKWPRR